MQQFIYQLLHTRPHTIRYRILLYQLLHTRRHTIHPMYYTDVLALIYYLLPGPPHARMPALRPHRLRELYAAEAVGCRNACMLIYY
jgi:hypothetical protein